MVARTDATPAPSLRGLFRGAAEKASIVTDPERLHDDLLTLINTQRAYSMYIPQRNTETGHGTSCYATYPNGVATSTATMATEVSDS